jgi:hypothetical protein
VVKVANISVQLEIHIGYVYGSDETPPHASHYTPKFVAGARLPHAWIKMINFSAIQGISPIDVSYIKEFSEDQVAERQYSTLDLCSPDSLTLIVPSRQSWTKRFAELQTSLLEQNVRLRLMAADTDFQFVFQEQAELFERKGGFLDGGALLVRPDQHLLACCKADTSSDDLESLVRKHLGW